MLSEELPIAQQLHYSDDGSLNATDDDSVVLGMIRVMIRIFA